MTRLATNVWNNIPSGVEVGEKGCGAAVGATIGTGVGVGCNVAFGDPIEGNIFEDPWVKCCTAAGAATGAVAGPEPCLAATCNCPGEFCKALAEVSGGKKKTRKQKKRRKTRKRKRKRTVKRKRKKRSIKKRRGKKRRKKTVKRTK